MSEQVLAAEGGGGLHIGEIPTWAEWHVFGLTLNGQTILGTLLAAAVVIGLGLFVRAKISSGVPNGVQLFFETITKFIREQVESVVGLRVAPYLVPLCLALFVFILASNWIVVLPLHHWVPPPTSSVNLVYALTLVVFVGWHADGIRRHNPAKHLVNITRGHYPPLAPLWLLEQFFVYPVSLSLRLFGNIFAGTILLSLFAMLPAAVSWIPNAGWKLFDMFIGLIQALIFVLLTIMYFSETIHHESEAEAH